MNSGASSSFHHLGLSSQGGQPQRISEPPNDSNAESISGLSSMHIGPPSLCLVLPMPSVEFSEEKAAEERAIHKNGTAVYDNVAEAGKWGEPKLAPFFTANPSMSPPTGLVKLNSKTRMEDVIGRAAYEMDENDLANLWYEANHFQTAFEDIADNPEKYGLASGTPTESDIATEPETHGTVAASDSAIFANDQLSSLKDSITSEAAILSINTFADGGAAVEWLYKPRDLDLTGHFVWPKSNYEEFRYVPDAEASEDILEALDDTTVISGQPTAKLEGVATLASEVKEFRDVLSRVQGDDVGDGSFAGSDFSGENVWMKA